MTRHGTAAGRLLEVAVTALALPLVLGGAATAGVVRVKVDLPIPARINTVGVRKVLVAKFLTNDYRALDSGREMVSFLRREISRGTTLEVLDVEPPNLPEQPPEDLVQNATFWKHIAEEAGADLVVSGEALFVSRDRSGFVQEDFISPVTGQKVRQTVYAEREDFELRLSLWFFKGASGALLYEDSFRESQIYEGKSNDALQAFFELADRVRPDILGVLVPQTQQDPRAIFTE